MKGLKINKVNFTTKVYPEWIERIRQIIAANPHRRQQMQYMQYRRDGKEEKKQDSSFHQGR